MRPRSILVWLLATATATAIAWAAVAQVTARTVGPLPAGVTADPTADGTRTPPVASPSPTSAVTPPTVLPTDGASPDRSPTTVTRSYQLAGGDVTVSFSARSVEIVSVAPRSGFTVKDINRHGPSDVEVDLRSEDHRSRLRVWWDDGPRQRIDED